MNIAAQGAHTGAFIAAQRLCKLATDGWIARSSEIDEENRAMESGCELVRAGAGEMRHGSGPSRGGEWKEQLTGGLDGGEPRAQWMRGASADHNHVGGLEGAA